MLWEEEEEGARRRRRIIQINHHACHKTTFAIVGVVQRRSYRQSSGTRPFIHFFVAHEEDSDNCCTLMPLRVYYVLQGEPGEDMSHPNVFSLPQNVPGEKSKKIKLQSILDSFPLRGTGEFHFRFKLATNTGKNGFSWVDVNDPNAVVPFYKGMLLAKLLRLDRPFYSGKQRRKDDWTFDASGSRPSNRRVKGEGKSKKLGNTEKTSLPKLLTIGVPTDKRIESIYYCQW